MKILLDTCRDVWQIDCVTVKQQNEKQNMTQQITSHASLTTEHSASSYGQPVLVIDGIEGAFGKCDTLPWGQVASQWVSDVVCGGVERDFPKTGLVPLFAEFRSGQS